MPKNTINACLNRKIIYPGGFYFGNNELEIYTLLGSCVAVTLWHPILELAGMCHIVLPEQGQENPSTRFADCAIEKFTTLIRKNNTHPHEYEVGIYGGGNMFPQIKKTNSKSIGFRNIVQIERLLDLDGFKIGVKDVGGEKARKLTLNRLTGKVILEYVK